MKQKIIYAVVAVVAFLLLVWLVSFFTSKDAEAKGITMPHHYEWGSWEDKTECEQLKCGSEEGERIIEQKCDQWKRGWATGNPKECSYGETREKTVGCCVEEVEQCEPEGICPTECGYEGGEVADGEGGTKVCEATNPCVIPNDEPTKEEKKESKSSGEPCDHKPNNRPDGFHILGSILKWQEKGSADKIDIRAYDANKHFLWNLRVDDDGEYNLGGLEGVWFKIRGMNNCGLGDWTSRLMRQ